MASVRVFIGQLIALTIVVVVSANAQFGAVAPKMIEGAGDEKYDMSRMSEPDCAPMFDRLEELIAEGSETNCLVQQGSGLEWISS